MTTRTEDRLASPIRSALADLHSVMDKVGDDDAERLKQTFVELFDAADASGIDVDDYREEAEMYRN